MRMVEALEGKGLHMALTRGEAKLGDHLRGLTRQVNCGGRESFLLILILIFFFF